MDCGSAESRLWNQKKYVLVREFFSFGSGTKTFSRHVFSNHIHEIFGTRNADREENPPSRFSSLRSGKTMLRLPYFMLCGCCHCKMFCAVPLGTILFPVKDYRCLL